MLPQTRSNIDAVRDMVMSDRRVTFLQIVETLGLSCGTVDKNLQIIVAQLTRIGKSVMKSAVSWVPIMYSRSKLLCMTSDRLL